MTAPDGPQAPPPDPFQVLDETRQHFVATFAAKCDTIQTLVDNVGEFGARGPVASLTQVTHRLSGLAGTLGFPTISRHASELEDLLENGGEAFDAPAAAAAVAAMRVAIAADFATLELIPSPTTAPRGAKILVVEDAAGPHRTLAAGLQNAGYRPIMVVSDDLLVAMAREERPAVILLELATPSRAWPVCRVVRADPGLNDTPVIVITTGANLDDRIAGLTAGADEVLSAPVDMHELILRIQMLIERNRLRQLPAPGEPGVSRELTHDAFHAVASEEVARGYGALAVVRLPADRHQEGLQVLTEEIRGRDALGAYGPTRCLILMPELTADAARDRLESMVDRLAAHGLSGVCAGVTGFDAGGAATADGLIAAAAEALGDARYQGEKVATWSERDKRPPAAPAPYTVVIAEDDPDVTRIVDAQVRAAGYKTIVAFDGEQALAAVRAHAPDVLVLDLMMPKLSGFDVLAQIREGPAPWPRIIVLSGRGREPDVVRGFELGADDYMTKPFNPQELMARIARLLK